METSSHKISGVAYVAVACFDRFWVGLFKLGAQKILTVRVLKKNISPSLHVPKQACHTISEGYTYDSLIVMLFSGRAAAFKKQVEKDRSHSTQSFIG